MLFRPPLRLRSRTARPFLLVFSLQKTLLFFRVSTKFYKITVDTYIRLVLEPKSEPENCERKDASEVLSQKPDVSHSDSATDKSMEISVEGKVDLVSDPNYPSFEILLDVAGKLLESFEER